LQQHEALCCNQGDPKAVAPIGDEGTNIIKKSNGQIGKKRRNTGNANQRGGILGENMDKGDVAGVESFGTAYEA